MLSKTEESTKVMNKSEMINGNNCKDLGLPRANLPFSSTETKGTYNMIEYFTTSVAAKLIRSDIYDNNL